jgi:hypothetical protein
VQAYLRLLQRYRPDFVSQELAIPPTRPGVLARVMALGPLPLELRFENASSPPGSDEGGESGRFVFFAESEIDEGCGPPRYYFDLEHPLGDDDARVVRAFDDVELEKPTPIYHSLRDFLLVETFLTLRFRRLPCSRGLYWRGEDGELPERLPTELSRIGLERLEAGSRHVALFEHGRGVAFARRDPASGNVWLMLAGSDANDLQYAAARMRVALGEPAYDR